MHRMLLLTTQKLFVCVCVGRITGDVKYIAEVRYFHEISALLQAINSHRDRIIPVFYAAIRTHERPVCG